MRFMKNRIRWMQIGMSILVLGSACFLFSGQIQQVHSGAVYNTQKEKDGFVVVVDAGHGGTDPGKIGVDGTLEKDLNLVIAKRVRDLLEQQDVRVIMTRETDDGLYEKESGNKKVEDMKKRCSLMNDPQVDCVVSIHQNSYHEEAIQGAQVFYYSTSKEGEAMAKLLQKQLIRVVDPENRRQEKANDSYYLLKKTRPPICIVECGFLSNWEESRLLKDAGYQEKLAWAIHLGVLQFLHE